MNYDVYYNANWSNTYTTSTATTVWPPYQQAVAYRDPLWDLQRQANLEGAAIPENDMAWLKRRVDEISWVPA